MSNHEDCEYCADSRSRNEVACWKCSKNLLSQREAELSRQVAGITSKHPTLTTTCLADVEIEPIAWLWPGVLARGKTTLLAGDPGTSKTTVAIDLGARITTGAAMPCGGDQGQPGSVVFLGAEDGLTDTVLPRLVAAGGDPSKFFAIDSVRHGNSESSFSLRSNLPLLGEVFASLGDVKALVIDPLSGFMDGCDGHKNAEVRGLLKPVVQLAEQYGCAVLLIEHLNKGSSKAAYRVQGSIGLTGAARMVYSVTKDEEAQGDRRLMLPIKCNLSKDNNGFAYSVVDQGGVPVIEWEADRLEMTADDALNDDGGAQTEACDWLFSYLSDNGPTSAGQVKKAAMAAGISHRTLERAKSRLKVKAKPYRKTGSGLITEWRWYLPEHISQDEPT